MRILVTGAAGYIGSALVRALEARPGVDEIIATDQSEPPARGRRVRNVAGNIAYPQFARSLVDGGVHTVFHLASLVSGGAEQNFELGTKVNLDATRDLLEACRLAGQRPRFVFTSSIAVYGGKMPDPVTDDTPPAPRLSYGAQKLVGEVLINDYSRRGFIEGCSLRLPGVMVRPGTPNTALSSWISAIIREPLAGRDYVCPVRADTRVPCISVRCVADNLVHASGVDPQALGTNRTVLLTGIGVAAGEMLAAAQRAGAGRKLGRVTFQPDEMHQKVFDSGSHATRSERAAKLGFRHNRDIDEIVAEALQDLE